MGVDRRAFLQVLGALPLLASGCACPPKRKSLVEWTIPTSLTPLAPERIQSKEIPLAFDVHAHLFNATDVHVRGFVAESIAHSLKPPLNKLMETAAPMIEQMGQVLAISCGEEMDQLAGMLVRNSKLPAPAAQLALRAEIDSDIDSHLSVIEDELMRRLPGSEFESELNRADQEYQKRRFKLMGVPVTVTPLSRDRERIRAGLRYGSEPYMRIEVMSPDEHAVSTLNPQGVLSFVRYMVSPRHHNLRAFQKAYSESEGAFGIDACFSTLVDFDYWLGCAEPSSSLRDQVLLNEQLAVLSGGYVLPIVPYNPWTDIKRDGESLKLVQWAIEERGCVGVKIYPPMGFSPLGNDQLPASGLPRPDGKEVDEKLSALYGWCKRARVPVMAHTAHSNGRDNAHDDLSSPFYWDKVINEFPGIQVNAGHFGGGYHTENGIDWPKQFVELMQKIAGSGFYVDLGFEEELLDPSSPETARMNLLLQGSLPDKTSVLNRVMYGSDWLMLSRLPNWGAYSHGINRFLSNIPSVDHKMAKHAVYFENAARCFGLSKGCMNRQRLEVFYAKWKIATPSWMDQLDKV